MRQVSIVFVLGWASLVWCACVDDSSFNIGYGGCSTYAAGQPNNAYCASDGAVTKCLAACGSCGGQGGSGQGSIPQNGQCMTNSPQCASGLICRAQTGNSMYGTCQPSAAAPTPSAKQSCGIYEISSTCGTVCEQKCPGSSSGSGYYSQYCSCASGFARLNSQCIPIGQCPQQQQAVPTQNVPSSSSSGQYTPSVNGVVGTQSCSTHEQCGTQNYCFGCTKCFLAVGYDASKTQCGGCYSNPLAPQPSNCGPVSACASRQDAINGQCPNYGNNPSCGPNEAYVSCASACEPSCSQPNPQCNAACQSGRCQCLAGYLRLGSQCVVPTTCPTPGSTCGTNEAYLTCSSYCEATCGQQSGACPAICGPPKCQCANGYYRSGSQCVLAYQCPSTPTPAVQQGTSAPPIQAAPGLCPSDNCNLYCSGGRVIGSNGCPLCQCVTQSQADPCSPSPCPLTQTCVPLSITCTTFPCQKYSCAGKTGGKPQGAPCVSSTECQALHICYKSPSSPQSLCLPGTG